MKHNFECHDILMLGKSPIKWKQRPDMTIAVDWGVKHQFKQSSRMQVCIPVWDQVATDLNDPRTDVQSNK